MGTQDKMLAVEAEFLASSGRILDPRAPQPQISGFMCEIAPAGATKWSGILHLADQWEASTGGIAPSATMSTICR